MIERFTLKMTIVGHLTLRDPEWVAAEVPRLAAGGVRLATIAPALVEGRRLSHPDHERMWATLADHGVGVVFHIAQYEQPFDDAWNEGDPDWSNPFLSSVFMCTAPALALADLIGRGVLARHPQLRIGIIELTSAWCRCSCSSSTRLPVLRGVQRPAAHRDGSRAQ